MQSVNMSVHSATGVVHAGGAVRHLNWSQATATGCMLVYSAACSLLLPRRTMHASECAATGVHSLLLGQLTTGEQGNCQNRGCGRAAGDRRHNKATNVAVLVSADR